MYVYDEDGNIVSLYNKSIYIMEFGEYYKWEAVVLAVSSRNEEGEEWSLHHGTVDECRDYMEQLAKWLKPHSSSVPSTPRPKREERRVLDELSF